MYRFVMAFLLLRIWWREKIINHASKCNKSDHVLTVTIQDKNKQKNRFLQLKRDLYINIEKARNSVSSQRDCHKGHQLISCHVNA